MPDTPKPGTPLPWRQDCELVTGDVPNGRPGGEVIVQCLPTVLRLLDRAIGIKNAAYIVHACNRLPELEAKLAELEKPCVWTWDRESWGWRASCRKALSDVKQGPPSNKFCGHCGHPITEDSEA